MKITSNVPRAMLAVVGLAAFMTASAQGPRFAVKAGANLSNFYKTEVDNNNSRFGFDAGVMGRSDPSQMLGFQAELLYTTKGNKTDYKAFNGLVDQTVDFNLNYVELPVMISIRLAEGVFEIQAGGYAGYLISSKASTEGTLGSGSNTIDKDNFNSIDAGLVGGIAFNAGPIQVGARYDYGLTKVADSNNAKFLLGDAKNSCAQLYLAVGMP